MLTRRRNIPTLFDRDSGNRSVSRFSDWLDEVFDEVLDERTSFIPQMNVAETDTEFEVTVALPGMSKDDIDISLDNNVLTISGERKYEKDGEENGRRYRVVETRYGKFNRSMTFPNIIDNDKTEAKFENGELIITIPKVKEKAGRKIEIS